MQMEDHTVKKDHPALRAPLLSKEGRRTAYEVCWHVCIPSFERRGAPRLCEVAGWSL